MLQVVVVTGTKSQDQSFAHSTLASGKVDNELGARTAKIYSPSANKKTSPMAMHILRNTTGTHTLANTTIPRRASLELNQSGPRLKRLDTG